MGVATAAERSLRIVEQPRVVPGFACGLSHPSLHFAVVFGEAAWPRAMDGFGSVLREAGLDTGEPPSAASPTERMRHVLVALHRLQQQARVPVLEAGVAIDGGDGHVLAWAPMPADGHRQVMVALEWLLSLLDVIARDGDTRPVLAALPQVVQQLGEFAPAKVNPARFLAAARELGIPFRQRLGGLVQFGHGARSCWMDSTFTEGTSRIAAGLARSKTATASMLAQAGLPSPRHAKAATADAALRIAQRLGYPVVVKPEDRDGGIGVAAGLRRPEQVVAAWHEARRHSAEVLVEKHVEGRDYRVVVFRSEVLLVVERRPAGVTGDGRHSVERLVAIENADPRRGAGPHAMLRRLQLDDEARELLGEAGLAPEAVPEAGRFVRLRRAANVAGGGIPVDVAASAHPDNLRLACRAAAALGLDLAGIDLLLPDIARSWHDTGALVCEVNSSPSLGLVTARHLYPSLLRKLVPGNGRVPVAMVVGADPAGDLVAAIARHLRAGGLQAGTVDRRGAWLDDELLAKAPVDAFEGGGMLLVDRRVEAIVIAVDDDALLQTGLPLARFDLLLFAGTHFPAHGGDAGDLRRALCRALLPACDGDVVVVEGSGWNTVAAECGVPPQREESADGATLAAAMAKRLLDRSAAWHAMP